MRLFGFNITKSGGTKKTDTGSNKATIEDQLFYDNAFDLPNLQLRETIDDMRHMDLTDPRVKKIHIKMSGAAAKGGLTLKTAADNKDLVKEWETFEKICELDKRPKLESDLRALLITGNAVLEVALDKSNQVCSLSRLPTETMKVLASRNGNIKNPSSAFEQWDLTRNVKGKTFALWEIVIARLNPENHDDLGCMGRPYLDATRMTWRKLATTERDLVLRRSNRAPLRMLHTLPNATPTELQEYKAKNEGKGFKIVTDFFSNKDSAVTAIQGDANLDQIADVNHLLDTFYTATPASKALFGYVNGLSRDVLEDLMTGFFDELDSLQDIMSSAYQQAFEVYLLFKGIDPDAFDFEVMFSERKTETPNQVADRALKLMSLGGYSYETIIAMTGGNAEKERMLREKEKGFYDPYPEDEQNKVTVVENNGGKGESATDIKNG